MNKKLFAINLNFDSLGEAYGWPKDFIEDSAFTVGVERILNLGIKLKIPITFFLIGKDLENKKNFEIIKRLSDNDNVEIANHSYNHLFNFGSRNEKTPLEWSEDIEINRFLEMGMKVKMVEVDDVTHAVDFPEDVKIVEELLNGN